MIIEKKHPLDNIFKIREINTYFNELFFSKPLKKIYNQGLTKKITKLCEKNIKIPRFTLDLDWKNLPNCTSMTEEKIDKKYRHLFPQFFLLYKPAKTSLYRVAETDFDEFSKAYPTLLTKNVSTHYSFLSWGEERTQFLTYILKERKKIIFAYLAYSSVLDFYHWIKQISNDKDVVRIIFPTLNFKTLKNIYVYRNLLSCLEKNLLYKKIIIQDVYGNTFFHEACHQTDLNKIKKFSTIYLNVKDNNGISPFNIALNHNNNSIKQYLIEQRIKQKKPLFKNEYRKLSTELKRWYRNIHTVPTEWALCYGN